MAHADDVLRESLQEFSSLQLGRATFGSHWEEVAELVLPTYTNTFFYGNYNTPGLKRTERQVDSTAQLALSRFAAICDSLLTPRNMFWHYLEGDYPYLLKDRETRLWMEAATRVLFKERYRPHANFSGQNQNVYQSLGAFGNGILWIDDYLGNDGATGLRYSARPLGEMYFGENFQGQVDRFCRWFRMNPMQAQGMAARRGWTLPQNIAECRDINAQFNFLHRVCPREDYDKERLDERGKPWASYYIAIDGQSLLSEGGYRSFPAAITRYEQAPSEAYGRGPAMMVLPATKTLNAEKGDFLRQGHRATQPTYLTGDDGIVDFSMRPGAMNKGGVNAEGKPMVQMLPFGEIQITKEMMDVEGGLINDAFLVSLFQILIESPQMTATEVVERINEKGILLAPTVGRQMSEYLGPMIGRELDVLASQRKLPPMPGLLREAGGAYNVVYTSPLARMMRAQEVAGFGRALETTLTIVNATQDPAPLDNFNFDKIIPDISSIQAVPESWMNSEEQKQAIRQARAQQQQQMLEVQQAPAAAALMSAQAKQAQAGMTKPMRGR